MSDYNLLILLLTILIILIIYLLSKDNKVKYENFTSRGNSPVCCWSKDTHAACENYSHGTSGKGYCSHKNFTIPCDSNNDCNSPEPTKAPTRPPTKPPTRPPTKPPTPPPIQCFSKPAHPVKGFNINVGNNCIASFDNDKYNIAFCGDLKNPLEDGMTFSCTADTQCASMINDTGVSKTNGKVVEKNGVKYCAKPIKS